MRIIVALMALCGVVAGYAQSDETPVEVTIGGDESDNSGEVAVNNSFANWRCNCKGNRK